MKFLELLSFRNNGLKKVMLFILIGMSTQAMANRNGKIGGNGGNAQNINCPSNQYAVGIFTKHNNKVIMRVRLQCAGINRNTGTETTARSWTSSSNSSRPGGDIGLHTSSNSCPHGQFLSPILKGHSGKALVVHTVVSGLIGQCVRFTNINTTAGTSRKQNGGQIRAGASFSGTQRIAGYYDQHQRDFSMSGLAIRSGFALDSVMINAKKMPWVLAPNTAYVPDRPVSSRPTTPARQPDLYVELRSPLWRYSGTTTNRGAAYRRVPSSFCSSGMVQGSDAFARTKRFTLPRQVQYSVVNAGGATAPQSLATVQFTGPSTNIAIPILRSGQRRNLSASRRTIQRCVVQRSGLSGCHECAGSSSYQDPVLVVSVDTRNTMTESNENNNVLRR